jgi:hypothetical protein
MHTGMDSYRPTVLQNNYVCVLILIFCIVIREELHNLYSTQYNIKRIKLRWMKWDGEVSLVGELRNQHRNLTGKPAKGVLFSTSGCRW